MENENIVKVIEGIKRVEWSNQPVLLTVQLAEFYGCIPKQIKQNYNNNRDRFVEGKHYFRLEGDEVEKVRRGLVENFDPAPRYYINSLYLWTERGAARHAKMLNTDKAWEVFEALEDNYFNRPARVNNQFAILDREWLAHERERLAFEREHARDDFAKAELLKDLAAASGHNQTLRNSFLKEAGRLLKVKEIAEEIHCIREV